MKQKNNPVLPKILGYLGLLPFVVPTFFLFYDYHHLDMWRHFLVTYAAVILSFLGALHWAYAMASHDLSHRQKSGRFIWSVIPSIVAWVSLSIPLLYALFLLALFFIICLINDRTLSKMTELPDWFMALRHNLTIVAAGCLLIAGLLLKSGFILFAMHGFSMHGM
jgi:ABC-type amino acid transport system permease subunit